MSFTVGLQGCAECGVSGAHAHGSSQHRECPNHSQPNARTVHYSIFTAAAQGELSRVKHILKSKAPSITDSGGYTALHYAAQQNRVEVVKYLCSMGAPVNAAACGATPLHRAAYSGGLESVGLLVEHGADVWKRDAARYARGRMAHHKAAAQGHTEIVALLLRKEPRLEHEVDTDGKLAADLARAFSPSPASYVNQEHREAEGDPRPTSAETTPRQETEDTTGYGFDCPLCSIRVYSGKLSRCCKSLMCEDCAAGQGSATQCMLCDKEDTKDLS